MTCAILSIAGFTLRGILKLQGSTLLEKKIFRIAPHIIDTVLLASAIALTVIIGQYPLVNTWLTAKVIGLLLYIFLGLVTLRFAKTQPVRLLTFVLAIAVFAYIAMVARTHNPFPFG
jgi:uncharacterized membrane protein SirB2